jgi:hypothetical protein
MKIHLHIERVVLDGLPVKSHEAGHVRTAIESELIRLLNERGLSHELQRGGAVSRLGLAKMNTKSADRPGDVGHSIAQAVHGALVAENTATRVPTVARANRSTQPRASLPGGVTR